MTRFRWCSLASALAAVALCTEAGLALGCGEALKGDMVTMDREFGVMRSGQETTMHVLGAGWFHAAEVVKYGGMSDDTSVTLELDGEPVITTSFADLKKPWMEINTPLLVVNVRSKGEVSTMTIWYAPELKFRSLAAVRVDVAEEGVSGLKMRTVMNKPAPHEHVPGQQIGNTALPVFR